MIERVVENWLTKASERTYEVAFCYMLTQQGHRVVHLTRHCSMELGKDIITIAPDGVPCAFQLKSGDVSLNDWRSEIEPQINDLVTGKIVHPAVSDGANYRPYFVTNGRLEEEVQRAIDDKNARFKEIGYETLRVYTKGNLLQWALELGTSLWPDELGDMRALIDLHLSDGKTVFPKAELAGLLEATLPVDPEDKQAPSAAACERAIASSALLTALSVAPFSEEENHVAEVEAWTIFAAYTIATAERWKLPEEKYSREISLAKQAIINALSRLAEEVHGRKYLLEGHELLDGPFYRYRITLVVAMLSVLGLYRRITGNGDKPTDAPGSPFDFDIDQFILDFCHDQRSYLSLWGEAAIPQLLAYYWLWRVTDATTKPTGLLFHLAWSLAKSNKPRNSTPPFPLPSPYYEAIDLLPHFIDAEIRPFMPEHLRLTKAPLDESFSGRSYYLEGLFLLVVRRMYKQEAKTMWPSVSKISVEQFISDEPWHAFRWRNEGAGNIRSKELPSRQSWSALRERVADSNGSSLPPPLQKDPVFALLFLCVYPHRASSDYILWLDSFLREEAS